MTCLLFSRFIAVGMSFVGLLDPLRQPLASEPRLNPTDYSVPWLVMDGHRGHRIALNDDDKTVLHSCSPSNVPSHTTYNLLYAQVMKAGIWI